MYTRTLSRHNGFIHMWSGLNSYRHSSSVSSLLLRQDIPAPHCGSICVLSLNVPKTRNAISRDLLSELDRQVNDIQSERSDGKTRALIIASNIDASFCAGADLKERAKFTPEETIQFLIQLRKTFAGIARLPIPTVTAVSSLALGGGLELALCTHLRVFATTATVALPESRLAIIPGAGGTYRLPALIGRTRALDMMLTGRRVAAAEAYFLGICDRLVTVDQEGLATTSGVDADAKAFEARLLERARIQTLDAAINLIRDICEGGPVATRRLIEAVVGKYGMEQAQQGEERENKAYLGVLGTSDRDEALRAFREKRKPVYNGR